MILQKLFQIISALLCLTLIAFAEERFGLQGIRQRARLLDTTATIESAPGAGTIIVVDFPIVDDTVAATE